MAFSRVLVTNDDGLFAPGLAALVASLSEHYDVYVVAPDKERSGVGHGFTLFNPLRADRHTDRFPEGIAKEVYSCSGLPADCVKLGLIEILKDKEIDLVVSGVNKGANMGIDVFYSGTVAGAREGIFNGVPAMAVSLVMRGAEFSSQGKPHFGSAADWAVRLIETLEPELRAGVDEGYFLNVNLGNLPSEKISDWSFTDVAHTTYEDCYKAHKDGAGRPHYWLEGKRVVLDERENTDVHTVSRGLVSVSPLSTQPGATEVLSRWRSKS